MVVQFFFLLSRYIYFSTSLKIFFNFFFLSKCYIFQRVLLMNVYIIQTYLNPTVDLTSRLQTIQWFVPKFENCRDEFKRCLKVVWDICRQWSGLKHIIHVIKYLTKKYVENFFRNVKTLKLSSGIRTHN